MYPITLKQIEVLVDNPENKKPFPLAIEWYHRGFEGFGLVAMVVGAVAFLVFREYSKGFVLGLAGVILTAFIVDWVQERRDELRPNEEKREENLELVRLAQVVDSLDLSLLRKTGTAKRQPYVRQQLKTFAWIWGIIHFEQGLPTPGFCSQLFLHAYEDKLKLQGRVKVCLGEQSWIGFGARASLCTFMARLTIYLERIYSNPKECSKLPPLKKHLFREIKRIIEENNRDINYGISHFPSD